jgi:hypothetical protein
MSNSDRDSDTELTVTDDGSINPANSGKLVEHITVNMTADIPRHQHAKVLRQVANVLHALLANGMRYAALGVGAGAGMTTHQQTFQAAANVDAAAVGLEQSMKQDLGLGISGGGGGRVPPAPSGFGRA